MKPIYTEHHLKLGMSLSNFLQNRRLGIIPVCGLCLIPNVTIMFVSGCVMNVTDDTCKSQITRHTDPKQMEWHEQYDE